MDRRTTKENTARHNSWKASNKKHRDEYMKRWRSEKKALFAEICADWYKRNGKAHYYKNRKKHLESNSKMYCKKVGLTRSEIMSRIKSVSMLEIAAKPIAIALAGCRLVHQPKNIFGKPDYANKTRKIAVFIDGNFWHGKRPWKCPKTNSAFWKDKIERNKSRATEVNRFLRKDGWIVIRIWESDVREILK